MTIGQRTTLKLCIGEPVTADAMRLEATPPAARHHRDAGEAEAKVYRSHVGL